MTLEEDIRGLNLLMKRYYKVLEVNAEDDSYVVVKGEDKGHGNWKAWALEFCGRAVHPDDASRFVKFFDGTGRRLTFYRRKDGDSWKWACMEIIPTEDAGIFILLVIDVNDFAEEWEKNECGNYWVRPE